MLRVAQRYLSVNFIMPFWASMIFFVTFLLISQLFRIVRIVVNKSVDFSVIMELISYIAVSFVPMATPLAIFFSTMYALNKLSQDSEIIALRSFGYTKRQLFFPFALMAFSIGLAVMLLNQNLIPQSQKRFDYIISKLTHKGLMAEIEPEKFFTGIPGVVLFAEGVTNKGMNLEKIFIKLPDRKRGESIIMADKGVLIKQQLSKDSIPSVRLHLLNGNISTVKKDDGTIEKMIFDEYDLPIFDGEASYAKRRSDRMRTTYQLHKRIKRMAKLRKWRKDFRKTKIEFWSRFNIFFHCMAFVLLGFCFGIKKGRGAGRNAEVIGIAVVVGYYILYFLGMGLTKNGWVPAYISVFAPTILMFVIGAHFFKKLDWAS